MKIEQCKNKILLGDAAEILRKLPDESIDCAVTSPPYWALRDYSIDRQIGLESTFQQYVEKLCEVFDEVKRVLKSSGTCWVNLGDTYGTGSGAGVRIGKQATNRGTQYNRRWQEKGKAGVKGMEKCLLQIPARFAIAMCDRGWILRNEIIWHKPNAMPQSAKDRFTVDFEKIFFFTKSRKYLFETQYDPFAKPLNRRDGIQLAATGRNKRCVWSINTKPRKDAHFATFPPALMETPIKAGCSEGGIVLDPFIGSGTTAEVARLLGRNFIGIELNPDYVIIANKRLGRALGENPDGVLATNIPLAVDRRLKDKKILKKS